MAASPAATQPDQQQQQPWPLFDIFLDIPHPAASKSCPPPFLIPSPITTNNEEDAAPPLTQVARFAFPEYEGEPQQSQQKEAFLNKYDHYAMQSPGFQHFTFSMQMQSGTRIYGHVRRYLPHHASARGRYDVGRRGERALVLLTRASDGAGLLFAAILKSLEAISSQQASLAKDLVVRREPQKWFLYSLFQYQQHLAKAYASKPMEERGKPLIAAIPGLEVGDSPLYKQVDVSRFILPTCLLHRPASAEPPAANSSILPLFRCLGVAHALRILSALLSERRVIMVSSSPTRLATCSHAAQSMLAQGLLHWQHLYIPVLPPHLWQYLAAPYPYLIGILSATAPRLDRTDGLGEVLIIHLDSNSLETRGMDQNVIAQRLPDLFYSVTSTNTMSMTEPFPQGGAAASAPDFLAQDLMEVLKTDKRILYGESTLQNMGETAAKATKAVKNTFFKLRDKGKQYLQTRSGSGVDTPPRSESSAQQQQQENNNVEVGESKTMAADYIYTEGCHNETCEEEARIAFANFFLCMFGNMRWYLSSGGPGHVPQLDRNRFLQQKRAMGEGEGTPMWPLLQNFCQTQMLEEFAKARVEEVRTRQRVPPDAPLFLQCAEYHRQHNIDFGIVSIRRVTRQVAQSSPSLTGMLQTNARRIAMSLTSNRAFEGDYSKTVAQLVEQCRESSSVLFDVMSVVWMRLRDSKGMQWRHGYQALQILKNLLYHGPMAAVTEATDGLDKIRAMKFYENMRSQSAQQVRSAANLVYNLLVDRSRLFSIRRFCAERRRKLQNPTPGPQRDSRLKCTLPFRSIHAAVSPSARGTIARIPPVAPNRTPQMERGGPVSQVPVPAQDLLGMSPAPAAQPRQQQAEDIFGLSSPPVQQTTSTQGIPNDMIGLFDNMAVSSQAPGAAPQQQAQVATPSSCGPVAPQPSPAAYPPHAEPAQVTPVAQTASPTPPAPYGQPPLQATQVHQVPAPSYRYGAQPPNASQPQQQIPSQPQQQIPVQQYAPRPQGQPGGVPQQQPFPHAQQAPPPQFAAPPQRPSAPYGAPPATRGQAPPPNYPSQQYPPQGVPPQAQGQPTGYPYQQPQPQPPLQQQQQAPPQPKMNRSQFDPFA